MRYIRLFENKEKVKRVIHLKKLYDYLVDKGIENIEFHKNVPQITNITNDITIPGIPDTFSVSFGSDIYIRTIVIAYLTPDKMNLITKVFKYNDFEDVLKFLKDLELQYFLKDLELPYSDMKKYNL